MSEKKFKDLNFSEAPKIITKPIGPKSKELLKKQGEVETRIVTHPKSIPIAWDTGRGATIMDADGNIYIDFDSEAGVMTFGHSNPEVIEAIKHQLEKLVHVLDYPTDIKLSYMEKLESIAPGNLKNNSKVFFGNPSGSAAVEAALRLAKANKPNRQKIISFWNGFHGSSDAATAITSGGTANYSNIVDYVPYAYCYRCAFGQECQDCDMQCLSYIDELMRNPRSTGRDKPGIMIVEPIQATGGIVVPSDKFLPGLARICKEHDMILIFDEIQAGSGRTGKFFSCENWGTTPDIIAMAKGLGGIGLPLGGILYRKELDEAKWSSSGTFRGNLLGCASGLSSINFMEKYNLLERTTKLGNYLIKYLYDLEEESKIIGDVRGKGLLIGVEIVKDKKTKEPGNELWKKIRWTCFERGIFLRGVGAYRNIIGFQPPVVITKELIDKGLEIFTDVIKEVEKEL